MNADHPAERAADQATEPAADQAAERTAEPGARDTPADPPRLGTVRQPIVKAAGRARRAKLMPAPDTDPNPHPPVLREEGGVASVGSLPSANDARLRQDRPPHW